MKLTPRQTAAVSILLDLYAEARHPISYRRVAERLGVAPATAYRMLRLAEAKGCVAAVYAPPPREISPGRSSLLFAPTAMARGQLEAVAGRPLAPADVADVADPDWEATKKQILESLSRHDGTPDQEAFEELLAGLEEPGTPLGVAGRMIAALMVGIEESRDRAAARLRVAGGARRAAGSSTGAAEQSEFVQRLAAGGTRFGLSTLGGMLLGLVWADRRGRQLARRLEPYLDRFQSAVASLSPEQATDLSGFAGQVDQELRDRDRDRRAGGEETPARGCGTATPGGRPADGHRAGRRSADAYPADGRLADPHPADTHPSGGHPADGHPADTTPTLGTPPMVTPRIRTPRIGTPGLVGPGNGNRGPADISARA